MKVFDGQRFVKMNNLLAGLSVIGRDPTRVVDIDDKEIVSHLASEVDSECGALGLVVASAKAKRLNEGMQLDGITYAQAGNLLSILSETILDEMAAHLFMYVEPTRVPYYTKLNLFGEEVAGNFSVSTD